MELKDLKKMSNILFKIRNTVKYTKDIKMIDETLIIIDNILINEDNITIENIEKIENNINYLDQNYDALFELTYLFGPINSNCKRFIKKKICR